MGKADMAMEKRDPMVMGADMDHDPKDGPKFGKYR